MGAQDAVGAAGFPGRASFGSRTLRRGPSPRPPAGGISVFILFILAAAAWIPGQDSGSTGPDRTPSTPPPVRRGDRVESRFQWFNGRLEAVYEELASWVAQEAPWLHPELTEDPPGALRSGYQILPEILPDSPPRPPKGRPESTAYSWPITERMVQRESERLMLLLEGRMRVLGRMGVLERQSVYPEMVADYRRIRDGSRLIEKHIEHNRLWQAAVAANPAAFLEGTRLHDAVVEREAVREALSAEDPETRRKALRRLGNEDPAGDPGRMESRLRDRERELSRMIEERWLGVRVPDYVRIQELRPGHWVVEVPLFTDIEDEAFLAEFRASVERYWRVEDQGREYRLRIVLHPVASRDLYEGSSEGPPRPGDPVDPDLHVARFPPAGAALTTGAGSIHVRGAGAILLGPQAVPPRTLAHEFGHVLGFRDGYLRGYRDLGEDGFEIVEVVPDDGDIMTSPGSGGVLPRHFRALLESAGR